MSYYPKAGPINLIRDAGAFLKGDKDQFTLKSGRKSDHYFDLRKVTLSRHVGWLAGYLIDALVTIPGLFHGDRESGPVGWQFDAIGGPALGAVPLVGAVLGGSSIERGFAVRPAEKGHGLAGLVVGPVRPGDRCVVVEDVTTSGGSLLHAIAAVRDFGCTVVAAATVLDRTGEVRPGLEALGIPFLALLTPRDFGIEEGP